MRCSKSGYRQRNPAPRRHAGRERVLQGAACWFPDVGDGEEQRRGGDRPMRRARRGERCLIFAFEESRQISGTCVRSASIWSGWSKKGQLQIVASRPAYPGLEMHLGWMHQRIAPSTPAWQWSIRSAISSPWGRRVEVKAMLIRLIDYAQDPGHHDDFHDAQRMATFRWRPRMSASRGSWIPGCC